MFESPFIYERHFHCTVPSNFFFTSQTFWTALAVLVALVTPWIVNWLAAKPKKSKLIFKKTTVVNQDRNPDTNEDLVRLLNVGRVAIKNEGKYIARSVEAYIDRINFDGMLRENFIPMPLQWTHGELNKNGPTIRDIYPNQTVFLDLFNHLYDSGFAKNNSVVFAVASGQGVDDLSRMNLGESELVIKLYQESGQVDEVCIRAIWNQTDAPQISIV